MAYAEPEKLAPLLSPRMDPVTNEEELQEVLDAAALEIDSELGRGGPITDETDPDDLPAGITVEQALALCVQVNLDRAQEHWTQRKAPFGIIGLGSESGPTVAARDSWDRHAQKLAPLKNSWGIA